MTTEQIACARWRCERCNGKTGQDRPCRRLCHERLHFIYYPRLYLPQRDQGVRFSPCTSQSARTAGQVLNHQWLADAYENGKREVCSSALWLRSSACVIAVTILQRILQFDLAEDNNRTIFHHFQPCDCRTFGLVGALIIAPGSREKQSLAPESELCDKSRPKGATHSGMPEAPHSPPPEEQFQRCDHDKISR